VKPYMMLTLEACVCRARMSLRFCWRFKKTPHSFQYRSDDFTKHNIPR